MKTHLSTKLKYFLKAFDLTVPTLNANTGISVDNIRNIVAARNAKISNFETISRIYGIKLEAFTNTESTPLTTESFYKICDFLSHNIQNLPKSQHINIERASSLLSKACFLYNSGAYNQEELEKFISAEIKKAAS